MPQPLPLLAETLREQMEACHQAREKCLLMARHITQASSRVIKHLHRRQWQEASALLEELRESVKQAKESLKEFPALLYSAGFQDALKEFVEASVFAALLKGETLPTPEEIGVEAPQYLNGLCEAASECRRFALDELRQGNEERAQEIVSIMEDVYDELITFDYPDALTANLRRNVDSLRAVLERTQNDVALGSLQARFIRDLNSYKEKE
jgi:translin